MKGDHREDYELSTDVVSFRPHSLHSKKTIRRCSDANHDEKILEKVAFDDAEAEKDRVEDEEAQYRFQRSRNGSIEYVRDTDSDSDGENDENVLITEEKLVEYPEGGRRAYLTLFACFLGLVGEFGLWNSTGAIESYISTHILQDSSDIAISMIFALFSFFVMFGTMLSGVIFDKYGGKQLCYTGAFMTTCGLMATANCTKLYQFILAFGVLCGLGCSLLTAPFVTSIGHFFSKKRGMALSVAMPGASIGGVIWPLVCRSLYSKVGFAWTMRTLGFCIGFILLIAALFVDDRHVEINEIKRLNEGDRGELTLKEKINDLIDFKSFKDVTFMILTLALFLNEFSLLMVSTYIPSYALSKGFSESTSLVALTIFNASGVFGRIIPTFLSDRYGNFNLIVVMSLTMSLSIWIMWLPFGKHLGAFMAFVVIFGFGVAGTLGLTPLCTSAISKPKDFGKRYGTAYFVVAFCNLISLPVGMSLTKTSAGYDAMVAFAGATCTLAACLFIYTRYRVGGFRRISI